MAQRSIPSLLREASGERPILNFARDRNVTPA
jgi:hypothetical protein